MEILKQILNKGDLCFDIGSNMGDKTQQMLNLGAKVVSVDPQKECFEFLSKRFEGNDNVIPVNFGCGPSRERGIIKISSHHTLSTMSEEFMMETTKERFQGVKWEREERVEILTLDDLIDLYGVPRFCKIDVEGYESEVLKGLSKQIEYLSLEFVPELKHKSFECMKILEGLGRYSFNYSEGESGIFEFNEWVDQDFMVEYLKRNNDFRISFGDLYAKKQ
jgi:FkbM family methyltransferase